MATCSAASTARRSRTSSASSTWSPLASPGGKVRGHELQRWRPTDATQCASLSSPATGTRRTSEETQGDARDRGADPLGRASQRARRSCGAERGRRVAEGPGLGDLGEDQSRRRAGGHARRTSCDGGEGAPRRCRTTALEVSAPAWPDRSGSIALVACGERSRMTLAVRAQHLTKVYTLHREQRRTLKEWALRQYAPAEKIKALDDVSFEVGQGDAFGVIGANGSGKSTLLKLVAGTAKPTSGTLETSGRVSALLEIGAGFHPDFSGRENAYLNGSLLGLSRREMDAAMPEVERFADIGAFFDAPVKTYSSGMYMRLGFAVAVLVDPDVLLVDEVLAVGDEYFQHKCFAKIAEFRAKKNTIVLVSHDLGAVGRLCERAIWLDRGRVGAAGRVGDVVTKYRLEVGEGEQRERAARGEIGARYGSKEVEIVRACVVGADGREKPVLESGEPAAFELYYRNNAGVADAVFGFYVYRDDGTGIFGTNTLIDGAAVPDRRDGVARFRMSALDLLPGAYDGDIGIIDPQDRYYDYLEKGLNFRVIGGSREVGIVRLPHRWGFE